MSPFDDVASPLDRETPWPRFEPLALGRAHEDDDLDDESRVWCGSLADPDDALGEALGPEPAARAAVARARVRLMPFLGATAVGMGGLLALFLLIGGPDASSARTAPAAASVSTAEIGR